MIRGREIFLNSLIRLKQTYFKSTLKKAIHTASQFPCIEKSMEEIRLRLSNFTGGSVELTKRDDGLAFVVLKNSKKKNAMTGKMMVDLWEVVEELSSWSTGKGVILKGASGDFCSGGDLDFVRQVATPEEGYMMSLFMQTLLSNFQRLPLVSVALIEGIGALGGGAELSAACDFILMSETCMGIGFVHGKMGLLPAWGGTNRLIEKIGYTKCLELLLTSKVLSPKQSLEIGLVNDIIPVDEDNEQYAISWLKKRTQFDADIIRGIKMAVSSARDFPREYEKERRLFAPFWGGVAHKEALQKNIKHKLDL